MTMRNKRLVSRALSAAIRMAVREAHLAGRAESCAVEPVAAAAETDRKLMEMTTRILRSRGYELRVGNE